MRKARILLQPLQRKEIRIGLVIGLVRFLFSWSLSLVQPGRLLGNPMPLVLALSALGRALGQGFAYFNWHAPALHLGYVSLLAWTSALATSHAGLRNGGHRGAAARAGRAAVGLNLLLAAVGEVDTFVVALFYLGGSYLSLIAAGVPGGWAGKRLGAVLRHDQAR